MYYDFQAIFAIKIPGLVFGSTSPSSTEPSTNAYEALKLGTTEPVKRNAWSG
jgi:hypothetical protein